MIPLIGQSLAGTTMHPAKNTKEKINC
uniref:Uncharacterized protein n=1 Tax=Rhizophora mucronata TaxID=61149 RepID=A0A2P2MZ79_RHIMU